MKNIAWGISLFVLITLSSCGQGKTDKTGAGDTTSTSDAVNRANGAAGLKDSVGRKVAGDTTASGKLNKIDTNKR